MFIGEDDWSRLVLNGSGFAIKELPRYSSRSINALVGRMFVSNFCDCGRVTDWSIEMSASVVNWFAPNELSPYGSGDRLSFRRYDSLLRKVR